MVAVFSAAVTRQGLERRTSQLTDELPSEHEMNDIVDESLSPPDRLGLMRFTMSLRRSKTQNSHFHCKIALHLKKVCYKVSKL